MRFNWTLAVLLLAAGFQACALISPNWDTFWKRICAADSMPGTCQLGVLRPWTWWQCITIPASRSLGRMGAWRWVATKKWRGSGSPWASSRWSWGMPGNRVLRRDCLYPRVKPVFRLGRMTLVRLCLGWTERRLK